MSIRNQDDRPRQESRVVGVRFPADHPIWAFPEGKRASRVKELVDAALLGQAKLIFEDISEIKNALKCIQETITRLEERLDTLEAVSTKQQAEPPPKVTIDPAAFMDI